MLKWLNRHFQLEQYNDQLKEKIRKFEMSLKL